MLVKEPLLTFISKRNADNSDIYNKIQQVYSLLTGSEPTKKIYKNGPWVAGGCLLRLAQGLDLGDSDIDVFFRNGESFNQYNVILEKEFNKYIEQNSIKLISRYPSSADTTILYAKNPTQVFYYKSNNALMTLIDSIKIQIINRKFYKSPLGIIGNFDLTISQFATDGVDIYYTEQALSDVDNKIIRFHNISENSSTVLRYVKFLSQGFTPEPNTPLFLQNVVRHSVLKYAKGQY